MTVPSAPTVRYPEHSPVVALVDGDVAITPLGAALDATTRPPGSKSLTNRAVLAAALADGTSQLTGVLDADDTAAMVGAVRALGAEVDHDHGRAAMIVRGVGGRWSPGPLQIDARSSGTTSRFVLATLALGAGPYTLDGTTQLRARPMVESIEALRALGATVGETSAPGVLPLEVSGGPTPGGSVHLRGDSSSQFLSGLCLAAPCMADGLALHIDGPLVSVPYVEMTLEVLRAFGGQALWDHDRGATSVSPVRIEGSGYTATHYEVEPDASAASYFFAAAAMCGGTVRVDGLASSSCQGDVGFVDVLEQMGAEVHRGSHHIEVRCTEPLHGVDIDMADVSDTVQSLAVVATCASSPTTIRGVGFIRHKETNRIEHVVHELVRCGLRAEATSDGMVIWPGVPKATTVATYDDHRMAMAFALLGLRTPGITIADPSCVAKTFPDYWLALDELARGAASSQRADGAR